MGVFPNDAAIERLVPAVIVEHHDECAVAERRHLSETSLAWLRQAELLSFPPPLVVPSDWPAETAYDRVRRRSLLYHLADVIGVRRTSSVLVQREVTLVIGFGGFRGYLVGLRGSAACLAADPVDQGTPSGRNRSGG